MRCGEGRHASRILHLLVRFHPLTTQRLQASVRGASTASSQRRARGSSSAIQECPKGQVVGPVPAPDSSMPCVEDAGRHVFLRNLGLRFAR